MSIILTDRLTYLHKGFLNYEWRQAKFVLYSNGMLAKIKDDESDNCGSGSNSGAGSSGAKQPHHKHSVDLKSVVKNIQTKSAIDYVDTYTAKSLKLSESSSQSTKTMRLLSQFNVFSHAKTKSKLFNSIFDCHERVELATSGGKDVAMLMLIPFKEGSKKKWIFLFMDGLRLQEWQKNINKWASIPKIEIDFVSLKDYKGYRDFTEETGGELVEFSRDENSTTCSLVSEGRPCDVTGSSRTS